MVLSLYRFDESRSLLHLCEGLLIGRLEDSSVLQLLAVADTVSTPSLRVSSAAGHASPVSSAFPAGGLPAVHYSAA